MEEQNQFQKSDVTKIIKIIGILGVMLVVITLLGLFIYGYYFSKEIPPSEIPSLVSEEIPQKEIKITLPKVLYNLAGTIKNLEKNSFVLEAGIPLLDENNQVVQKIEIRKVLITSATKISQLTFVTQAGTDKKTPKEILLTFKDLKIGDYVEVISNQDISQAPEFEVTQVRVLPKSI